jgi:hypothetical protein
VLCAVYKSVMALRGHACAVERTANTLHSARIDAKPNCDLAHALSAPRGLKSGKDSSCRLVDGRNPAEDVLHLLNVAPIGERFTSLLVSRVTKRGTSLIVGHGTVNLRREREPEAFPFAPTESYFANSLVTGPAPDGQSSSK